MHDQATRMREIARRVQRTAGPASPWLLVVTSGKGGVGKSTVSLNAAIKLADAGKKVLLVDADTNLGSLDVMLGVSPRFRLGHVLRGEMALEDVLIRPQPGLTLLPASSGDINHPVMDPFVQAGLMEQLQASDQDIVLLDTGAGLYRDILGYCEQADEVLVVSGAEPTAVMDAYAMMKTVWSLKPEAAIQLVLNNVRSPREAEDAGARLGMAVRHFLHRDLPMLGTIPADAAVPRAVTQQQPVVRAYPRSAASLSLQALAYQLLQHSLADAERRTATA